MTLLSNAVMAWNTLHMQRALDAIEAIGGEAMRQIAPAHLEGINLRGTFDFPIARYAHRLLPIAAIPDSSTDPPCTTLAPVNREQASGFETIERPLVA